VDVPNCQVKFSLNIAAACLLARNETAERQRNGVGQFGAWNRGFPLGKEARIA
jgi:hypothetical protein